MCFPVVLDSQRVTTRGLKTSELKVRQREDARQMTSTKTRRKVLVLRTEAREQTRRHGQASRRRAWNRVDCGGQKDTLKT